ncbi:MAG: hypothetical protein Q7K42_02550, partial [Candidatus Diapherotrites archaeon]|nr:hypothetical protein [Candidatus Diapherotrites archaeon]
MNKKFLVLFFIMLFAVGIMAEVQSYTFGFGLEKPVDTYTKPIRDFGISGKGKDTVKVPVYKVFEVEIPGGQAITLSDFRGAKESDSDITEVGRDLGTDPSVAGVASDAAEVGWDLYTGKIIATPVWESGKAAGEKWAEVSANSVAKTELLQGVSSVMNADTAKLLTLEAQRIDNLAKLDFYHWIRGNGLETLAANGSEYAELRTFLQGAEKYDEVLLASQAKGLLNAMETARTSKGSVVQAVQKFLKDGGYLAKSGSLESASINAHFNYLISNTNVRMTELAGGLKGGITANIGRLQGLTIFDSTGTARIIIPEKIVALDTIGLSKISELASETVPTIEMASGAAASLNTARVSRIGAVKQAFEKMQKVAEGGAKTTSRSYLAAESSLNTALSEARAVGVNITKSGGSPLNLRIGTQIINEVAQFDSAVLQLPGLAIDVGSIASGATNATNAGLAARFVQGSASAARSAASVLDTGITAVGGTAVTGASA